MGMLPFQGTSGGSLSWYNGMQNGKEGLRGRYEGSAGDGGRGDWEAPSLEQVFYRVRVRMGDWICRIVGRSEDPQLGHLFPWLKGPAGSQVNLAGAGSWEEAVNRGKKS